MTCMDPAGNLGVKGRSPPEFKKNTLIFDPLRAITLNLNTINLNKLLIFYYNY